MSDINLNNNENNEIKKRGRPRMPEELKKKNQPKPPKEPKAKKIKPPKEPKPFVKSIRNDAEYRKQYFNNYYHKNNLNMVHCEFCNKDIPKPVISKHNKSKYHSLIKENILLLRNQDIKNNEIKNEIV